MEVLCLCPSLAFHTPHIFLHVFLRDAPPSEDLFTWTQLERSAIESEMCESWAAIPGGGGTEGLKGPKVQRLY